MGWDDQHPPGAIHPGISIHPPRMGWDRPRRWCSFPVRDFNPPTPYGVGRYAIDLVPVDTDFNPPTPYGVGPLYDMGYKDSRDFNPPTPYGVGQQK